MDAKVSPPDQAITDAIVRVLDQGPETPIRIAQRSGIYIQTVLRTLDHLEYQGRVTQAFGGGPNKAVWMLTAKRWNDRRGA